MPKLVSPEHKILDGRVVLSKRDDSAALEINDSKDTSKAADMIKKSLKSGKGSLLVLAIKI